MFYCNECRVKKGWPQSLAMSVGKCEVCGKSRECHSVPSRELPLPAETSEEKLVRENLLTGDGAPPSNPPFIDRIRDLENALMVLDVTLFCLVATGEIEPMMMVQIRASAEAYQHATGEPSMLVENRCHKDFTKEAASAEGK